MSVPAVTRNGWHHGQARTASVQAVCQQFHNHDSAGLYL